MAAQLRHLLTVAALPPVTLTVMPAVAHPGNASELIIADNVAYAEHMAGGFTYTDEGTVSALVERLGETWAAGVSPLTRTPMADPA
jgi:hypothetical protein